MHVVDISDPRRDEKIEAVRTILAELHLEQINEVLVLNKCDTVDAFEYRALARKLNATSGALEGVGLDLLRDELAQRTRSRDDETWEEQDASEDPRKASEPTAPTLV